MALFKVMKTKWIEVMIIVLALGLLSLCFAAWDNTRPGAADPFTTWPALMGANWDALEVVLGVNLVGVHPYYQSATPLKKPDASTNLDADDLGRIWIDSDDERMYVFTAVTPTWTSYPSLTLTNTWTDVQTLADGSLLATSAAPTADAEIANKKYVDDHGVVQVVNTQTGAVANGNTLMPFDDSIPQKTEGDEYMTLAITPTSATNKLKIEIIFQFSIDATKDVVVALFQDDTDDALAVGTFRPEHADIMRSISFSHYMTADTTSPTTFKVRAGSAPATATRITFNGINAVRTLGGVMVSSITITEIKV